MAAFDAEALARARQAVRDALGAAVAEKASDEFCEAFVRSGAPSPMLEAFATGPTALRAVLELAPREPVATLPEAVSAEVADRVRAALQDVGPALPQAETALVLLLRQAGIRAERDAFYREAGALRDAIERAASAVSPHSARPASVGITASAVQACWLNRTIRAEAPPGALADVTGDPTVQSLDVP